MSVTAPAATTTKDVVGVAHAMIEAGYDATTAEFWERVYPAVEHLAMSWARRYRAVRVVDDVTSALCELLATRCDWTMPEKQVRVWIQTSARRIVVHALRSNSRTERREVSWATAEVHAWLHRAGRDPTADLVVSEMEEAEIERIRNTLRARSEWLAVAFDDLLEGCSWPAVTLKAQPFTGIRDARTMRRIMREAVRETLGSTTASPELSPARQSP